MSNIKILKVKPENVQPMKVVDMYAMKGKGGIINYKYVQTYFKLAYNEDKNVRLIEVTFDVPVQDIQSRRLKKGCIILVEKFPTGLKYLGVDGDWETMLSYGVHPHDEVKFGTFSEEVSESLEYDEQEVNGRHTVTIKMNGETIADICVQNGVIVKNYYTTELGGKLASDWLESRGYTRR